MAADFPRTALSKRLYHRLSMTFGHCAYYDLTGFFSTFFEDTAGKIDFLQQTLQWPCWGDPEYTYSDVERVIQTRLRRSGLLEVKQGELAGETRRAERATLDRLKAKYEPSPASTEDSPPAPPAPLLRQADLFDPCAR